MWDRESAVECARLAQQECAQEVERLRARDFFCVYCGQVFSGSESADTLKAHVAVCPEHPLSKANAEVERLKKEKSEDVACFLTSRQEGINDVIEKVLFYTRTEWDDLSGNHASYKRKEMEEFFRSMKVQPEVE